MNTIDCIFYISCSSVKESLENINLWNDYILSFNCNRKIPKFLIINDKDNEIREVFIDDILQIANKLDLPYFIITSTEKYNVDLMINEILSMLDNRSTINSKHNNSSLLKSFSKRSRFVSSQTEDTCNLSEFTGKEKQFASTQTTQKLMEDEKLKKKKNLIYEKNKEFEEEEDEFSQKDTSFVNNKKEVKNKNLSEFKNKKSNDIEKKSCCCCTIF